MRDFGLTYEQAGHGVQTAIMFELCQKYPQLEDNTIAEIVKHLRTGIDLRAADAAGLARLLIAKNVFTNAEYLEYMRLAANEELARYEQHVAETYNMSGISFR